MKFQKTVWAPLISPPGRTALVVCGRRVGFLQATPGSACLSSEVLLIEAIDSASESHHPPGYFQPPAEAWKMLLL